MDCEFTASVMQNYYHSIQFADGSFQCTAPSILGRSMNVDTDVRSKSVLVLRNDA